MYEDSFVPTEDAKLGIINLPKGTQMDILLFKKSVEVGWE